MMVWKQMAVSDRKAIAKHIARDNPVAAVELLIQQASCWMLPKMGCLGRMKETREWMVHPNYVIVYCIEDELEGSVIIFRMLHTTQFWPA